MRCYGTIYRPPPFGNASFDGDAFKSDASLNTDDVALAYERNASGYYWIALRNGGPSFYFKPKSREVENGMGAFRDSLKLPFLGK